MDVTGDRVARLRAAPPELGRPVDRAVLRAADSELARVREGLTRRAEELVHGRS